MMDIPTVKELIELEEKSVRTLTLKEILRDKPLDEFADMSKALPFAEEDGTEVEGEEEEQEKEEQEKEEQDEEEEAEATVELREVKEVEETETS